MLASHIIQTMPERFEEMSEITLPAMPTRVHVDEVWYEPGSSFGLRIQQDLQFVIVHRGSAEVAIDGQPRLIAADQVGCLRPGHHESFQFDRHEPTHHSWVSLSFEPVDAALDAVFAELPFVLGLTRRMQTVLDTAQALSKSAVNRDDPTVRHLAVAFFYSFVGAIAGDRQKPVPEAVNRARRFILEHHARSIDLDAIADAANVSGNHLVRLFRQHLGITPVRYLWDVRAERGADLLRDTGLSVSEVAYRVGFATPYHFSRVIKRRFGASPRQLREARWSGRSAG